MANWPLRQIAPDLCGRYQAEGLWIHQTLGQLLHHSLESSRDREFRVWSATRPYQGTVGQVYQTGLRLAAGLTARGVGPGDVVAFQLPNWPEAAAAFWGVTAMAGVLVPIVHFYGHKEVEFILRQSGAKALITADHFGRHDYVESLEAIRPCLDQLEVLAVVSGDGSCHSLPNTISFPELVDHEPLSVPVTADPGSPAVIAYTSGTTSEPKGVVHTHLSLGAELHQMAKSWPPEQRASLMGAPVGHAIGMLGGLLGPVHRGKPIHLTDVWDPAAVLAAFLEADLVFSGGATYFLTSLLDDPSFRPEHLDHIKTAGLGGSPVPAAVGERAAGLGISVMRSYGSTEHPSITGASYHEAQDKRIYTDGHALPGVEMRLVDEQGKAVEPGRPGAIHSRGPELCAGYTDAELTARCFDADGWYSTGDVGVMDEDGWLIITDRIQDIIIRGGENISAAEVEEQLLRMLGIAEAAVVAAPDRRLGEHACAFVRLHPGSSPPSLEQMRHHLESVGLAPQKWPEDLRVVDDLPRTPSSKVKKFVLRDLLRAEDPGTST